MESRNLEANQKIKYSSYQKIMVVVATTTAFVSTFTGSALNLSIPDISMDFGASASFVGWIITGYTLAVAAFSVPFGRIADLTDRRNILVTGILIFVLCCGIMPLSTSITMILIIRIIQGIGAAMMFSTNTAMLIGAFPGYMRGKVLGYSIAATYVGLSLGPVLGGILNHNLGWKAIFGFTGLLGLVSLVLAFAKIPRGNNPAGHEISNVSKGTLFDIKGNILYICSITLVMYGLSEINRGIISIACVAVGLILGIAFGRNELRAEWPAVKLSLFRNNIGYTLSNLSALMNYAATFAISYLISIYLQVVMGYSSQMAGIIMIFQPAIMALLTPTMGRLSDKFSPFRMSSIGMGFCAVGTLMFSFLKVDTSMLFVIVALGITGVGFALFSSPNTNAIMSFVEKKDYGVASSIVATMRTIGQTSGMVIVTIIVSATMPNVALADAGANALVLVIKISFLIFTGICIVGIFISLKRKSAK